MARYKQQLLLSQPCTIRIPGKPGAATSVACNATTIRVDWSAPVIPSHGIPCGGGGSNCPDPNVCPTNMGYGSDADGGVMITRYVVEWDTVATFDSANSWPLKGSAGITDMSSRPWTYYISDLLCYDYYIRIYAYNTVGQGHACNRDGSFCDGNVLSVTTLQLGC